MGSALCIFYAEHVLLDKRVHQSYSRDTSTIISGNLLAIYFDGSFSVP